MAFYTRVLGMEEVTSSENRKALSFGTQKINLHEAGKRIRSEGAASETGLRGSLFPHCRAARARDEALENCGLTSSKAHPTDGRTRAARNPSTFATRMATSSRSPIKLPL